MLPKQPPQTLQRIVHGAEVEEIAQQCLLVLAFCLQQMRFTGSIARMVLAVLLDDLIRFHAGRTDLRTENDSFETSAAAQGNIDLPVRKGRACI